MTELSEMRQSSSLELDMDRVIEYSMPTTPPGTSSPIMGFRSKQFLASLSSVPTSEGTSEFHKTHNHLYRYPPSLGDSPRSSVVSKIATTRSQNVKAKTPGYFSDLLVPQSRLAYRSFKYHFDVGAFQQVNADSTVLLAGVSPILECQVELHISEGRLLGVREGISDLSSSLRMMSLTLPISSHRFEEVLQKTVQLHDMEDGPVILKTLPTRQHHDLVILLEEVAPPSSVLVLNDVNDGRSSLCRYAMAPDPFEALTLRQGRMAGIQGLVYLSPTKVMSDCSLGPLLLYLRGKWRTPSASSERCRESYLRRLLLNSCEVDSDKLHVDDIRSAAHIAVATSSGIIPVRQLGKHSLEITSSLEPLTALQTVFAAKLREL
jgi:hypothetical protein